MQMHINSVRKNNGMNNREILFKKKETEEKCHQHTHRHTHAQTQKSHPDFHPS